MLMLLGQADGGISAPPLPPETAPEAAFPRVIRTQGQVCVESLDASGAVKSECRAEGTPPAAPAAQEAVQEPAARLVGGAALHAGAVFQGGSAFLEGSLIADLGARFRSGVGVVGLLNGHYSLQGGRLGLGAGLRLGDRSHLIIGATGTVQLDALPITSVTALIRGVLVVAKHLALELMPTVRFSAFGIAVSLSAGIGFSF